MKFSVLMSLYDGELASNLIECFDSLFKQTKLPNEIVLIIDGPIRKELDDVVQKYSDLNLIPIVKFSFNQNQGLGIALNKGVTLCQYDYIARMDTDDICNPKRFEIQTNFIDNNCGIALLGSSISEFYYNKNNVIANKPMPTIHKSIVKYSKYRNPFNHMTIFVKKDAILSSGNYLKLSGVGYEDYDLWVRIIQNNYITANINEPLVYARTGKNMYIRRGSLTRLKTGIHFRKKLFVSKYISFFEYISSLFMMILFTLTPVKLKELLYIVFLRIKKKNY